MWTIVTKAPFFIELKKGGLKEESPLVRVFQPQSTNPIFIAQEQNGLSTPTPAPLSRSDIAEIEAILRRL